VTDTLICTTAVAVGGTQGGKDLSLWQGLHVKC